LYIRKLGMPIFLDSHDGAELPTEVIRGFLRAARTGHGDDFGVVPLDMYCGEQGRVFCVLAAPDEAAVRQQHAAQGVICRRVLRVPSNGSINADLSTDEKLVVREMIATEQTWSDVPGSGLSGEWLRQVG
jgi:hypothetical protein